MSRPLYTAWKATVSYGLSIGVKAQTNEREMRMRSMAMKVSHQGSAPMKIRTKAQRRTKVFIAKARSSPAR